MNLSHADLIAAATRSLLEASLHANRAVFKGRMNAQTSLLNAKRRMARKTIAVANKHGLTIERPYIILNGVCYGMFCGELAPLFGKEAA